ncbi:MAG: archaeosortase/exosortase family protein [Bacteroidales bacterium]|nr:archaeosortase/exosortase family protein [Bacteroidales bacterium]
MKQNLLILPGQFYRQYPVFSFVGLVALFIILFYFLYRQPLIENVIFTPLVNFYARLSGHFLSIIGFSNEVSADMISSSAFSVSVKKGCDAAEPMAIFIVGILAFPALIKQKLAGLGFGLTILFALNIIRIASLYLMGIYYPDYFEAMHLAVWQVAFILIAVMLWFLWLSYVVNKPKIV